MRMRRLRQGTALGAALCSIAMFAWSANAEGSGFRDVPADHWAYPSVSWAHDQGIVDGYSDESFRPDQQVGQIEFTAMLLRTFKPTDFDDKAGTDVHWSAPYHSYESAMRWRFVEQNEQDTAVNEQGEPYASRGYVAQLVAAANGRHYSRSDAVRYMLDAGFSEGKTAATEEGYMPDETLTRAEAVTFVRRLSESMTNLYPSPRLETAYDPATAHRSPAESMPLQVQNPPDDPLFRYSKIGFDEPRSGYVRIGGPSYTVTGVVYEAFGSALTVEIDEVRTGEGFVPVKTVETPMKEGTFRAELVMPSPGLYRVSVISESHVVHRSGTALITWFYVDYKPD
ncbi:S-layer homology domain-containing protein [Paenibacillus hodogayensis]|uniref:S-layer homology domain-containing protein n=1 Tax=Paenibacillus hodogayensis TaxID=279208 RepID=A0ABV5W049_9BACL